MGELRLDAIGPWDLLDVSEEPEAAGRWTTVPTTGVREVEQGENAQVVVWWVGWQGGWLRASSHSQCSWQSECVGPEEGRTPQGL